MALNNSWPLVSLPDVNPALIADGDRPGWNAATSKWTMRKSDGVFNVRDYNVSGSTTATTGGITTGLTSLVVASASSFAVGQGICVVGAGAAGVDLVTTIAAISGTTLTLTDAAGTTVAGAAVSHDDTVAIQAAVTAAEGCVYFPSGIYAISSTINLKSNTEYRGPSGGAIPYGQEHPVAGYGAALKWTGANSQVMVNASAVWRVMWSGIDLDGVAAANGIIGIRYHSLGAATSTKCTFEHFSAYNLDHGFVVGGLVGEAGLYQADGWEIASFYMLKVNTGILVNGSNASQAGVIRGGAISYYEKGIYIKLGSYQRISDVMFGNYSSPHAGSGNIVTALPRITTIQNCQGEPWAPATVDYLVRFADGGNVLPVTLIGNYIDGGIIFDTGLSGQKVVSVGNVYRQNIVINGSNFYFTSRGDTFDTGVTIVDGGAYSIITEEDNYYVGVGQFQRRYFNQALVASHGPDSIEVSTTNPAAAGTNEIQTITIDAAGGHWHAIFGGQTTAALDWNCTAADLQTAFLALSSVGAGHAAVTGGPGATAGLVVTFAGALGSTDVGAITTDATALTGGAGTAVVVETLKGVAAVLTGPAIKKMEVFDAAGASLGYVPIYDAIT